MFPLKIFKFEKQEEEVFDKYFVESDGNFYFEGMWFRNQRPENKNQSDYVDETTQRRRYIHFYNTYQNIEGYFTLTNTYIYVSNTLKKEENKRYLNRIENNLKNFKKIDDNTYEFENLWVIINKYDNHPKNKIANVTFPKDYNTVDVVICSKNYDYKPLYDRMWEHSTKLFRIPGKRDNPTYIKSAKEILPYLPAQIEMGCGPSIEAGIAPLYNMHETYKVQNHQTRKFYFADNDDFVEKFLEDPKKSYIYFSKTPENCIKAKLTKGYRIFQKLYEKGYFVGTVLNNNFDRLVKRMDIDEKILRTYKKETYIPKVKFEKGVKSLICFGCHADRRQVEKQAREAGLKVIYIDPECFIENGQIVEYPLEAPQKNDFVYQQFFENAMIDFEKELLK